MTQPLEEQFYPNPRAEALRRWPCLQLFRAFRLAIDPRKMLLGAVAAVLLAGGQLLLDRSPLAPTASEDGQPAAAVWPWERPIVAPGMPGETFELMLDEPFAAVSRSVLHGPVLLEAVRTVVGPGRRLFMTGNTWPDVAYLWTQLLFSLAVWSVCGGAMARIAALQFAHGRGPSLREAVGYSVKRCSSAFSAPLLPLVFIAVLWLICVVVGLIGRIPGIGEAAAGVLWIVPLLCGIALAVMLLFIAAGWPLMVCTVSVEGTDGFDGLSRAYDYLLSRPWYALGLLLGMLVYGSVAVVFVMGVATIGVHLAEWGVSTGMNDTVVQGLTSGSPPVLEADSVVPAASETSLFGSVAVTFWLQLLALLLWGFVHSFFWSSATIIYFLLRQSADAMPLDRVYVPSEPGRGGPPVVGIPAAERAEAERQKVEGEQAAAPVVATPGNAADSP